MSCSSRKIPCLLWIASLVAALLTGCGAGGGNYQSSARARLLATQGETLQPGTLQVTVQYAAVTRTNRALVTGVPDTTRTVLVHVVDPATGQDVVPPVTAAHGAGQSTQTVLVSHVPQGLWQYIVTFTDETGVNVGYYSGPAEMPNGGVVRVGINSSAELASVALSPTTSTIPVGSTQAFTVTATLSDGSTANVTSQATWTSSAPTVAVVSSASGSCGVITGVSAGTTTITATMAGKSATATVTVGGGAVHLVSVAVTPSPASVGMGGQTQLTATGTFSDQSQADLTTAADWSSSDPTKATVSNVAGSKGRATAVAQGSTTITATMTAESISGSTTLTVTPPTIVSIAVTPANPSIGKGTTQQFTATATLSDTTQQVITSTVTWSSSNTDNATISNTAGTEGLATASASNTGASTISATDPTTQVSGQTTLTVINLPLTITPGTSAVSGGQTRQFTATGGTPPYTWSKTNVDASIDTNGLYTAPQYYCDPPTDVVKVTDSTNAQATANVNVIGECGGVYVDATGIYFTDQTNKVVWRMDDMTGTNLARLKVTNGWPWGVWRDGVNGNILVGNSGTRGVYRFTGMADTNPTILTTTTAGGALSSPRYVCTDSSSRIYIGDSGNSRVVRVDDIAGSNAVNYTKGYPWMPYGLYMDESVSGLYVADYNQGNSGYADVIINPFSANTFYQYHNAWWSGGVSGIWVGNGQNGNDSLIWVAYTAGSRVCKMSDLAGSGYADTMGFNGPDQGGPSTSRHYFNATMAICEYNGKVYVADYNNRRIVRLDPTGFSTLTTGIAFP